MNAPDKWIPSITVDGSVEYDGGEKTLFFPYDEWAARDARLGRKSRVDVLVKERDSAKPVWLVEGKDFRWLNHLPGKGNTVKITEKLEKKLVDTLDFLDSSSTVLPDAAFPGKNAAPRYFGYHYEMPKGEMPPYFPAGYPTDQIADLETKPVCKRVSRVVLLTSEKINTHEEIPWKSALNDSRKGEE